MGSSGQTCRTEAGFRKGSKYTSTGPCSSARQRGCGAPENTGLTYTRLVSSRAEPKATRSEESWLPLMANTGRPRAASWVRNQSSRRTASAGGTGLSYRSPASSTPSTGWASSRARICSRMYFWSSSMENSHTRLPRCRSERCAKRKSEHRLSKNCCSYYIAGRALAATLSVTASPCEKGLPENPQIFRKPRIKTIFSSEFAQSKAEGISNRSLTGQNSFSQVA